MDEPRDEYHHYSKKLDWLSWPATVPRNFDANGSPCDEPGRALHAVLGVMLCKPVDHIQIDLVIG